MRTARSPRGQSNPGAELRTGSIVDEFDVGPVHAVVRYGCIRRDQYELTTSGPLPTALGPRLAAAPGAELRGGELLFVVDVRGVHQITVAPRRGRIVVMPRLGSERPAQRAAVRALCELIGELLADELVQP